MGKLNIEFNYTLKWYVVLAQNLQVHFDFVHSNHKWLFPKWRTEASCKMSKLRIALPNKFGGMGSVILHTKQISGKHVFKDLINICKHWINMSSIIG